MKTLKRTLCLVLVAVMALGLFAVAASAKKLSDYSDASAVSAEADNKGIIKTRKIVIDKMKIRIRSRIYFRSGFRLR